MKRKRMTAKKSRKSFAKGSKSNARNSQTRRPQRGGYRL